MGAVLKAEIKRAFTGIRFPAAAAIIFLILELNSLRFREAEDILYLFIHTWGRSVTPLLAMAAAALAGSGLLNEDRDGRLVSYAVLRAGRQGYAAAKASACFLGAAGAFFLGDAAFLLFRMRELPVAHGYKKGLDTDAAFLLFRMRELPVLAGGSLALANFAPVTAFGSLMAGHTGLHLVLQGALYALYCGSAAVLAMGISAWCSDTRAVYAAPFFIHFVLFYVFSREAVVLPCLSVERIYDICTVSWTGNRVLFLSWALLVSGLMAGTGAVLVFKGTERNYR